MRAPLLAALIGAALVVLPAPAGAQGPFVPPLTDLFALGAGQGQQLLQVPVQHNAEPELTATPLVPCGPGAVEQPGVDGRIPKDAAKDGLRCNVEQIGHTGNAGGFRVWRYVDAAGHECAYYDTALLFPSNAFNSGGGSMGVEALDMSDPTNPKKTATLTELPMLSPHESFNFNARRGLLAAVLATPATAPGLVSIYDASADCRHPVLQSTTASAQLGHESGFSHDGRTFYAASTAFPSVTAVDVSDPKAPHPVWVGQVSSHGISLSPDDNRAYVADATGANMTILDVSEVQARKEDPQVKQVSRLSWSAVSIPQNAMPFTRNGHPYVLEFDEYSEGDNVGGARIIDIEDETQPRVIANLRLGVSQPEAHAEAQGDPGAQSPVQGYGAHYCNLSSPVDPTVVACSFITSGLRVFDISKLTAPKQIGYFVAPTISAPENFFQASAYAMSQPQIVPERKEIWYSDGTSGFYVLRVADAVWPKAIQAAPACKRRFVVKVKLPRGARVKAKKARLGRRPVKLKRRGRVLRVRGKRPARVRKVVVKVKLRNGRVIKRVRRVKPCPRP